MVFEKVLKDEGLRPLHLKILVNRCAEPPEMREEGKAGQDNAMVTEVRLAEALRELLGDQIGKQETQELRNSFAEMQVCETCAFKDGDGFGM